MTVEMQSTENCFGAHMPRTPTQTAPHPYIPLVPPELTRLHHATPGHPRTSQIGDGAPAKVRKGPHLALALADYPEEQISDHLHGGSIPGTSPCHAEWTTHLGEEISHQ